jgi:hypothetical protein
VAWTTPKTWGVSDAPTAAELNTYLRDNTNFLFAPPGARVRRATTTDVLHNVALAITFNTADYNSDNMWSQDADRLVFNTQGYYLSLGQITWQLQPLNRRACRIERNGVLIARDQRDADVAGTSSAVAHWVQVILRMETTNNITLVAFQNSGATIRVESFPKYSPVLQAQWLSN